MSSYGGGNESTYRRQQHPQPLVRQLALDDPDRDRASRTDRRMALNGPPQGGDHAVRILGSGWLVWNSMATLAAAASTRW